MVRRKFLLGILVMVLVLGMTVVGCDSEDEESKKTNNTISSVTISGTPAVGVDLTTTVKNVDGYIATGVSYQWQRADTESGTFTNIADAAKSNYTLTVDDSNKYVKVQVTNSDTSSPVLSSAIGPVDPNKVATPIADPAAGLVVAGQGITLTSATNGASIYYTLDGTRQQQAAANILLPKSQQ